MQNQTIRLGLIVPSSNTTMETEFHRMVPHGITLHSARMRMQQVTPEELRGMDEDSVRAAEEVADAKVSAIAYGCTIAIMSREVGYDEVVRERLERAVRIPVIISATAVIEALRVLGIQRIALATPYLDALAATEAEFMRKYGFEIVSNKNLNIADNVEVGNQAEEVVYELVRSLDSSRADGVLISCAQLPSIGVIERLERELEKPVVSTNTATLWAILRRLGWNEPVSGYGQILTTHWSRTDQL
jgi:maleate isomerase